MPMLADLIHDGASACEMHFVADGEVISARALLDRGARVVSAVTRDRDAPCLATVLLNTPASVSAILGSIAAGVRLVSLPMPSRAQDLTEYGEILDRAAALGGTDVLLVDDEYLPLFSEVPFRTLTLLSHGEAQRRAARSEPMYDPDCFSLVQHTSGSTGVPRGVVLDAPRIAANVVRILERLGVGPGDVSCSWLPFAHDMGLIGMLLSSVVGSGSGYAGPSQVIVMRPETFLQRPAAWLDLLAERHVTITSTPDFALRLLSRQPSDATPDLHRIRAWLVGGEPVRASTLETFCEHARGTGLSPRAFCPSYGMAEAVLAVSITAPADLWRSVPMDVGGAELADVVACGPPLPGISVTTATPGQPGELIVTSPSIAERYSDGQPVADGTGSYHTHDSGLVVDGEVFVTGRLDDVVVSAGRKLPAATVDEVVGGVQGVRHGRATTAMLPTGAWIVAVETRTLDGPEAHRVLGDIRRELAKRLGARPDVLLALPAGRLPMTASGKAQRSLVAQLAMSGDHEALAVIGEI